MVAPPNVNASKARPPPVSTRCEVGSEGGGGGGGGGYQGTPRTASAKQHSSEVLHQRSKMPLCPAKMAVGGVVVAAVLGYLTLYTKKKPDATALDVARVTTGTATTENTRPR